MHLKQAPAQPQRLQITITPRADGAAATAEDAIRAVEAAVHANPLGPGDVFVFLGMEYPDGESVLAAVRALQPLWE